MLDTRRLRLLVELDRLGTIAAVADALQQTASGISMQLSVLEREVGLTVTERHGRRLRLTPAGRLLAQHGRAIIERLSVAELEIESLRRGAAGTYVITAFPSAARTFVSDVWRHCSMRGPAWNSWYLPTSPNKPSMPSQPARPTLRSCIPTRTSRATSLRTLPSPISPTIRYGLPPHR